MIFSQLKSHFSRAEPVTRDFVQLVGTSFRPYSEIRALFFEKIPQHLHQSELISLVNVEVKNRLFEERFCGGIPEALKHLRRAIIRLEDLRAAHPDLPERVNTLGRLATLAEKLEALYQKHWEYYRYQNRLNERDLVSFVLEIDQIGYEWDNYTSGLSALNALMEGLEGPRCPEELTPLRISYRREAPHHFSVGTLQSLISFLDAGYRFICAASEVDAEALPLRLLQLEVADPVELSLAVPTATVSIYRRFLHYLFLKDMLKREALLKVVFEAVGKEVGRDKAFTAAQLTAFQKELTAQLKQLPEDGRFTISDRTFPDDGVRVLQEFTASLDEKRIKYDQMLRGESRKPASTQRAKPKESAPEPKPAPEITPPPAPKPRVPTGEEKGHIGFLTEESYKV